ncbi:hypothetical protein K0M31_002454 [Melipona bicolor]|uniref:Uncharacterized protein n=1 Tax=Melipona bicolor TaxID=60889 RepID=A0AA40GHL2_9HYME|nr:hypothetical protein K0M31_002454 [Melipona bicolor]
MLDPNNIPSKSLRSKLIRDVSKASSTVIEEWWINGRLEQETNTEWSTQIIKDWSLRRSFITAVTSRSAERQNWPTPFRSLNDRVEEELENKEHIVTSCSAAAGENLVSKSTSKRAKTIEETSRIRAQIGSSSERRSEHIYG